jgi:hypothetical protein
VGASTSRANGCNEWRAVVATEDVRRRMRRLIQSASQTPDEASSKAFFADVHLKAHAKEKGGGKGEFCGKVRDSKQGFRGARHVSQYFASTALILSMTALVTGSQYM